MVEGAGNPPKSGRGWPRTALSSCDRSCSGEGAAAGDRSRRRQLPAWTPSPTSCSRCSRSSAPAAARPRSATPRRPTRRACRSRSATTRRSARSPRSCSWRARSASRPRAQYVDWAAIAPQRPAHPRDPRDPAYDWAALDADVARYGRSGLDLQLAFWHVPSWANGGAAPNAWPLDRPGPGRLRLRDRSPLPAGDVCSTTGTSPTCACSPCPTRRGLRADGARRVRGRPRGQPGRAGRGRQPRALPRRGTRPARWAARLRADAVPMDFFGVHPYPLRRAPLAVRDPENRIDLLDVPALARLGRRAGDRVGVRLVVGRRGRRSAGRVDGTGDRARPLHARARRLRVLGLPRPPGATRRHARSVGPLRLARRRRSAQARLPGGLRRAARAARLHRGRARGRRAGGLAAAQRDPVPRLLPIRRRAGRPRGRGRAARGS